MRAGSNSQGLRLIRLALRDDDLAAGDSLDTFLDDFPSVRRARSWARRDRRRGLSSTPSSAHLVKAGQVHDPGQAHDFARQARRFNA
jgi:hypothetical protein